MSTLNQNPEPSGARVWTGHTKDSWIGYAQQLQFTVGDFCLREVYVPGLILDVPFMKLTTNVAETLPPWREFPPGVEVAVVSGQPVENDLPRMVFLPNFIRYVTVNETRYFIDLRGSFAEYLQKFSSKSRSTLRRKVRRFAEFSGGQICWREFRSPQEIIEFLRLAREVSRKTYQERTGHGLPDSEEFRQSAMALANRDSARGYILFHGEQPIAYIFCDAQKDNLIYEHLGYDPEFRAWSPGTVLLYLMLEKLFAEQLFRFLDFGGAEYDYKKFFATANVRCARVLYFRRTLRNLLLLTSHSSITTLSFSAGKVLNLLRLKDRIKNFSRLLEERQRAPDQTA